MTTTYIDLNAANAKIINTGNNNRFSVQMNEGMRLPTGTQVSVQNSFINYQGVVGASIEIREQIVEEIAFGYYKTETFDEEPYISDIRGTGYYEKMPGSTADRELKLLKDMGQVAANGFQPILKDARLNANPSYVVPADFRGNLSQELEAGSQMGNTETCLPIGTTINTLIGTDDGTILIPSTFRARIQIDPGVYSVDELANSITDQINGAKIASKNNKSSREVWNENPATTSALDPATNLFTNTYCFCPSNVEDYTTPTGNDVVLGFKSQFAAFTEIPDIATRTETLNEVLYADIFDVRKATRPGNVTEDTFMDIGNYNTMGIGVTQSLMDKSFKLIKTVPESEWVDENNPLVEQLRPENFLASPTVTSPLIASFASLTVPQNNKVPTGYVVGSPKNVTGNSGANIGNQKFMIGTTRFRMNYDSPSSLYTVSGLHQDRKQPSHDMFANTMPTPGQTSIYHKQIRNNLGETDEERNLFARVFNKYMTRLGGIYIYNWAVRTAKSERTNNAAPANSYSEDYYNFDEFFLSEEDAKTAWNKTLWGRLGFAYDQLQNPSSWIDHQPLVGDSDTFLGFTTDMVVDSSIASSISCTYGGPRTAEVKAGGDIFAGAILPITSAIGQTDVTQVACYNLLGINVAESTASATTSRYNFVNQANIKAIVNTDTYQSGFYLDATMRPIVTADIPVKAKSLPRLNNSGYFLITSSALQNTDIISKMSPTAILDVVPISSLASTDFLSNRNSMVHTLTNEKILNSIDINIVYPDGTDPILQANSAVLLQITTPLPPITTIIAQGESQNTLQAIEQQAQQQQASAKKVTKKK